VYLDEERRDDLAAKVFGHPRGDVPLPKFMASFTGADRFSLVINNFEQASAKLAADFAVLTNSYFRAHGLPVGGTEQVAFCGNYSGTAFGIHQGFEHALLCHLGPGTKYFYCWSREIYVAATGGREPTFAESPFYKTLLDQAECFPLEPGDILYLPASVYHIGRQTEYSVSVALPLYTYPLRRFAGRGILPALVDLSFDFEKEGVSALLPLGDPNPVENPIKEILKGEFENWLGHGVKRLSDFYWSRLLSNGGWELPQAIAADLLNDELGAALPLHPGTYVRLKAPYQVVIKAGLDCEPDCSRAFCAGRSVVLSATVNAQNLASELNSRKRVAVIGAGIAEALSSVSRTGGLELCGT
jgi:hypothetical protein